jgi:hypothetical protein
MTAYLSAPATLFALLIAEDPRRDRCKLPFSKYHSAFVAPPSGSRLTQENASGPSMIARLMQHPF